MLNTNKYHQLNSGRPPYTQNPSIYHQTNNLPSYNNYHIAQDIKQTTRGMSEEIGYRGNQLPNEHLVRFHYGQSLKDQILSPGDDIQEEEVSPKPSYPQHTRANPYYYNTKSINTYNKPIVSSMTMTKDTPVLYLPQQRNGGKKTLVLDLDETLVHSAFKPFFFKADLTLNVHVDNANHNVYVLKRPHCDEFLQKMAQHYEIVVFTASISQYASPLLDRLDPNHLISHRLFREHCVYSNGLYIKDLKRLGRNLKDTLIVDNNPISYTVNKENGIPILTWHYDKTDTELMKLVPLLEALAYVDDVREYIKNFVTNNTINFSYVNQFINKPVVNTEQLHEYQNQYQYYNNTNDYSKQNFNHLNMRPYEEKCPKCNCTKETINSDYPSSSLYDKWKSTSQNSIIRNDNTYNKREVNHTSQSINDAYEEKPGNISNNSVRLMSYTPNTNYRSKQESSYGSYTGYFNERYRVNNNSANTKNPINEYYSSLNRERDHELNESTHNTISSNNPNNSMILMNNKYSSHVLDNQPNNNNKMQFNTLQETDYANRYRINEGNNNNLRKEEIKSEPNADESKANQTIPRNEYSYQTPFQNYSKYIANKSNKDEVKYSNMTAPYLQSKMNADIPYYNNNSNYNNYQSNQVNRNINNDYDNKNEQYLNKSNERVNYHMRSDGMINTNKSTQSYSINNYFQPNTSNNKVNNNSEYQHQRDNDPFTSNPNNYQPSPFEYQNNNKRTPNQFYYSNSNVMHPNDDKEEANTVHHYYTPNPLRTPIRDLNKASREDMMQQQQQQQMIQSQQERELTASKSVDRIKNYDSPIFQYYRENSKNIQQTQPMYLQERENNLSFSRLSNTNSNSNSNEYNILKPSQPQYKEYTQYKRVFGHLQKN